MGFPFNPQPADKLKEKLSWALSKVWTVDEELTQRDRPGLHLEHIFDFQNGLRLIISRDKFPELIQPVIHVSGSYPKKRRPMDVLQVYDSLSAIGLTGTLNHIGESSTKTAHWFLELSN